MNSPLSFVPTSLRRAEGQLCYVMVTSYTSNRSPPITVRGMSATLWPLAQVIGIVSTAALIAGLFVVPHTALNILWNVAIPLLPASFLIHPALWRNVCPLATLNMVTNGLAARRVLGVRVIPTAGLVGIALLGILVPARRFLFNTNGPALATVIILVILAALLLGAIFDMKAGFCNAICPVLPVERLYGQHPLVRIDNPRCAPCTMCTIKGCIDVAAAKSIAQTLGRARRSHAWLSTWYGVFAAAFPGFVAGYYTTQDGPLTTAGTVYLTIVAWAGGSYVLTQLVVRAFRIRSALAMPALAAVAVALYYWFAAALIAPALQLTDAGTVGIRVAALALIVIWFWRAQAEPKGNTTPWPRPAG